MSTPATVYDNSATPAAAAETTPTPADVEKNDVPVLASAPAPAGQEGVWDGRKAHICCGFCCDCYRAVIIVNMIAILFSIITFILSILYLTGILYLQDSTTGARVFSPGIATTIFSGIAIFIYGAGIYGALNFSEPLVMMTTAYRAVEVIVNFIFLNWIGALVELAFLYPHIVFIMEMRSGIMTQANYKNVENSMCCV